MQRIAVLAILGFLAPLAAVLADGFTPLDDLTGYRQVATDGRLTYAVAENGSIVMFAGGRRTVVDAAPGTLQVAVDRGILYAQKADGALWRRMFGTWERIGNPGTRQIVATAGRLYTLESNDDVWMWDGRSWSRIDNGSNTRMIAADRISGKTFVLKANGNIFEHRGGTSWAIIDDGTGTRTIEAGGDMLHALKDNGNIWRFAGGWARIDDGTGTRQIESDGAALYVLKDNGNVWMHRDDQWQKVDDGAGTTMIDACAGEVVLLGEGGRISHGRTGELAVVATGTARVQATNFALLHGSPHGAPVRANGSGRELRSGRPTTRSTPAPSGAGTASGTGNGRRD